MKYYTPTQLAKEFKVSRQTFHKWITKYGIEYDTLANGQKIIAETDVPTFLRQKT